MPQPSVFPNNHAGRCFLEPLDELLRNAFVPLVPSWLQTYHLTLLTLPWSILVILFSYLTQRSILWLWAVSAVIVLQYLTDLLDGEIGRRRGTGLIKWGYYMDHFLDFIFLCALLIGYYFILPPASLSFHFYLLAIAGGFMVNSFLAFAVTNRFRISYLGIGPTEIRIVFILINSQLALFGVTHLAFLQPYVLIGAVIGLTVTVYHTQREIWYIDQQALKKNPPSQQSL